MRYNKLSQLCQKYEIVCFDIFDTLLKRDVLHPTDVFELMEYILVAQGKKQFAGFAQKRKAAEREARERSSYDEITIDEIYSELEYAAEDKIFLKAKELETESKVLKANPRIKKLYNACREKGKTIYIISDMYLPKVFLEDVLHREGYNGYKELYLSCDYRQTKKSGKLFQTVCSKEHLQPKKMLHIGDSRYADCIGPMKSGIRFAHIARNEKNTLYFERPEESDGLEKKYLYSFINNRENTLKKRAERLGYEVLGPIIYGYCQWLHEQIQDSNAKIWFIARDMYLFDQTYRQMYGEESNIEYIYLSRKSLRPAYTDAVGDPMRSGDMFARGRHSIKQIITYMGYSLEDVTINREIDVEAAIYDARKLNEYPELRNILNSPRIARREQQLSKEGYSYLAEHGLFSNDIILADVGWHGTTQYILSEIQKSKTGRYHVEGYYLGCLDGTDDKIDRERYKTFFFDEHHECMFMKGVILFERMILAPHGSTLRYEESEGISVPILEKEEPIPQYIIDIQTGAKTFIEDMSKNNVGKFFRFQPETIKAAFEKLVGEPLKEELDNIGELEYEDFYCSQRLASPKSILFYAMHFNALLRDLKYSSWRIGFLYRLFKVRMPYAKIYAAVRRKNRKLT